MNRKRSINFLEELMVDPFEAVSRFASKLYGFWATLSYPFASMGKNVWIHYSCELPERSVARYLSIGNDVSLQRNVWLDIPVRARSDEPVLILEDGCKVNRQCIISAINRVQIGRNTIFGPSVFISDHNDAYDDPSIPIADPVVTQGGTIRIEEGCWIGFGAAIVCNTGDEIVIGRNSVIGANALVTRSVPPIAVVVGNPARVVKQFDLSRNNWAIAIGPLRFV